MSEFDTTCDTQRDPTLTRAEAKLDAQARMAAGEPMRTGEIETERHEDGSIEIRFANAETALSYVAVLGRGASRNPEDAEQIVHLMDAITYPVFGDDPNAKLEFALANCEDPAALLSSLLGG